MSLHYIIDGYNIINNRLFAANHRKMRSPQAALLELIKDKRLCGSAKNQITVVFDGYCAKFESRCPDKQIQVIFSQEESADDKIKKIIDTSVNLRNIVVVSEDKEISCFAKYAGCKAMSVIEFMGYLTAADEKKKINRKEKDLSKQDLNYSQIHKINDELKKLWLSD